MSNALAKNNNDADPWTDLNLDDSALQNLLDKPLEQDKTRLRDGEQHEGFDNNVGDTWIYPINLPCRAYQLSIVQAALYRNTLVVLPTGLGKTFIAAVVMYNIYRWYPRGKVIFMAPTRPLVNQQIEACQKIMPFPKKDTVELTGKLQRAKRSELWKTKRVFFATPQVVQSDIFGSRAPAGGEDDEDESSFDEPSTSNKTNFPFDLVKLIVIDEAHKAKGKYAYTEVTQAIAEKTKYFRVLALSATPGRTMEDVAEVCRNLFISHLEVRWDTSIDVLPYVHKKAMETVVVSLGEQIQEIREKLLQIIDPYLRQLIEANMLSGSLSNINRNFLLYEQKRYRDSSFHNGCHPQHSMISSNFAICISLYHALELLERHGLRVFLNNFEEDEDGKAKFVLQMDLRLRDLVNNLKQKLGTNPFEVSAGPMTNGKIAEIPRDLDFGHPKFEKARECLVKHFQNNDETRAIVFCEYRESVMLIYRMLLQHVPLLKPRCFVGHGGKTGSLRALTQKQQIQIMNDFRSGKSNILIATSIGEEGIDVGEVDLIVCFDISTSNPTRFVQRIGRTGRQKNGRVVMLVTEGREQQLLKEVMANKDSTNKKLLTSIAVQQALYKRAPRMVPTELKPKCMQMYMKPPSDDEEELEVKSKKSLVGKMVNKTKQQPEKGTQNLRKFFNNKPTEMDKEDLEYFELDSKMTQAKPGVHTQQKMEKSFDNMKKLFKDLQAPLPTQTQRLVNTKDSPKVNRNIKNQKTVTGSQSSIKGFLNNLNETSVINLCDKEENQEKSLKIDTERIRNINKYLKSTLTTPAILKRSEISDIGYHLKSSEMSNDMKQMMLLTKPEYIKENLEHMKVITALQDSDSNEISPEEKSIKEINSIILQLFGGLEKVESLLQDIELKRYKQKCLQSDNWSDEEEQDEAKEMEKFKNKLDNLFEGLGTEGKRHDNSDWIQERLKQTNYYKEYIKTNIQNVENPTTRNIQQSMVYDTFAEPEEEDTSNENLGNDDYSFTESKYCSQWQEFNKPDLAFKSTPVQGISRTSFKRSDKLKTTTSLLTKLEETKEEHEDFEDLDDAVILKTVENAEKSQGNCSTDSKQIQGILEMLEKNLNENSVLKSNHSTEDSLEELEMAFKAKREDLLTKKLTNNFENFKDDEEDEIFKAAAEAELQFTQNQTKESKEEEDPNKTPDYINKERVKQNNSNFIDPNKTPDSINLTNEKIFNSTHKLNSTAKLTPPSLNSTPDFIEQSQNPSLITPALPTPPEISIQQELDIDMEAFMEPFPEEQELINSHNKTSSTNAATLTLAPSVRRESFKENLIKDLYTRQSPDLFAEDLHKSPIKPICQKKPSLASKLSTKMNIQQCQSSLQPTSSYVPNSPHKRLSNSQNPATLLNSPSTRLPTNNQKHEKSPSLFDMYLKSTKGKGKLPKTLINTSTTSLLNITKKNNHSSSKDSSANIPTTQQNDSMIVVRRKSGSAPKRKIFDSDSDSTDGQENANGLSVIELDEGEHDSDFEEIPATQVHNRNRFIQHRRKRRRFNSFIEEEAGVSGTENSEDEAEHTLGHYVHDSVVVASDDEDPDQASTSHMKSMYLQSLKSPQQRRGAFKIPAPRVYNDHSRIFSQPVLPEETYSQYIPDSFVVQEDDSFINNHGNITEVSMCPLEKAEKILKERRKAKKLGLVIDSPVIQKPKRKKKIQLIEDSSSDEFE